MQLSRKELKKLIKNVGADKEALLLKYPDIIEKMRMVEKEMKKRKEEKKRKDLKIEKKKKIELKEQEEKLALEVAEEEKIEQLKLEELEEIEKKKASAEIIEKIEKQIKVVSFAVPMMSLNAVSIVNGVVTLSPEEQKIQQGLIENIWELQDKGDKESLKILVEKMRVRNKPLREAHHRNGIERKAIMLDRIARGELVGAEIIVNMAPVANDAISFKGGMVVFSDAERENREMISQRYEELKQAGDAEGLKDLIKVMQGRSKAIGELKKDARNKIMAQREIPSVRSNIDFSARSVLKNNNVQQLQNPIRKRA